MTSQRSGGSSTCTAAICQDRIVAGAKDASGKLGAQSVDVNLGRAVLPRRLELVAGVESEDGEEAET